MALLVQQQIIKECYEVHTSAVYSTTEQAFDPELLSRLLLDPGLKEIFVPGPMTSRADRETEDFGPGWSHQPGQKDTLLSRLMATPGTKSLSAH